MPPAASNPAAPKCNYKPASELFAKWKAGIEAREKPELWPVGKGDFASVEVGPGRVVLLGGQPGAGETALAMQWTIDALRLNGDLRAVVLNVEMQPQALLTRQLARLTGVDASTIRKASYADADGPKLQNGFAKIKPLLTRLAFVNPPFTLDNVIRTAADFKASLVVIDYVQRLTPPPGKTADKRLETNATMEKVRQLAGCGAGIIAVAAVNRPAYAAGKKSAVSMGSFRESSELEYGADDAFILCTPDADTPDGVHELKHLKSRNGQCVSLKLQFNKPHQSFRQYVFPEVKLCEMKQLTEPTSTANPPSQ